jgi:hypothetical protein
MIDLAQADSTLRTQTNDIKYYYVKDSAGFIHGSFDSHSSAIRFALKDIDNRQVITQTN